MTSRHHLLQPRHKPAAAACLQIERLSVPFIGISGSMVLKRRGVNSQNTNSVGSLWRKGTCVSGARARARVLGVLDVHSVPSRPSHRSNSSSPLNPSATPGCTESRARSPCPSLRAACCLLPAPDTRTPAHGQVSLRSSRAFPVVFFLCVCAPTSATPAPPSNSFVLLHVCLFGRSFESFVVVSSPPFIASRPATLNPACQM